MKTINAKGNGPKTEALARAAVERGETELEVLLDDPVSASGVVRFLENKGFGVQLQDDEGTITISARKGELPSSARPPLTQPGRADEFKKQFPAPAAPTGPVYEVKTIVRPNINAPGREQTPEPVPATAETFSALITRRALGSEPELGETLMKNFLSALTQMDQPPAAVALINEGVKLALYDSSTCDHLKNLEKKGVPILVSSVCANYFSVMDEIGAGTISGMPEIIETVNRAVKVITL